jgi:hypothetical protein
VWWLTTIVGKVPSICFSERGRLSAAQSQQVFFTSRARATA